MNGPERHGLGKRVASKREGEARRDRSVQAAIAARQGGDEDEYARLLTQARAANDRDPRLVLLEMDASMGPADQLTLLATLQSEESEVLGLIAAQRAVAHLITPDIPAAREALRRLASARTGLSADRWAHRKHRRAGRSTCLAGAPLARPWQPGTGGKQAAALREQFRQERRFSEATRMVMLEADAALLLSERGQASRIVRGATPGGAGKPGADGSACVGGQSSSSIRVSLSSCLRTRPTLPRLFAYACSSLEEVGTPAERQRLFRDWTVSSMKAVRNQPRPRSNASRPRLDRSRLGGWGRGDVTSGERQHAARCDDGGGSVPREAS